MTKTLILMVVPALALAAYVAASNIPISWVSSGDYNAHVMKYRPSCEEVLKRYMPNERKQHMSYAQYIAMSQALKQCNAHATPGITKQWAMVPMK